MIIFSRDSRKWQDSWSGRPDSEWFYWLARVFPLGSRHPVGPDEIGSRKRHAREGVFSLQPQWAGDVELFCIPALLEIVKYGQVFAEIRPCFSFSLHG